GLAGAAVDHVAGVLGVGQDLGHGALGPVGLAVGGRVGGQVGVETAGDRPYGQPGYGAPGVDLVHHGRPAGVQDEAAFGLALGGFGGGGVLDPVGLESVRRVADIPAGQGMFLE